MGSTRDVGEKRPLNAIDRTQMPDQPLLFNKHNSDSAYAVDVCFFDIFIHLLYCCFYPTQIFIIPLSGMGCIAHVTVRMRPGTGIESLSRIPLMRSVVSRRPRIGRTTMMPNAAHRRLRRDPQPAHNNVVRAEPAAPLCGPGDCTPGEEISHQDDIHREAVAIVDAARTSLNDLARRSQEIRSCVSCDQEDWPGIVRDYLEDMMGDTFGCLPNAIERAARELRSV